MIENTSKKVLPVITALAVVCLVIGLFVVSHRLAFVKGLAFGTIFSLLKWMLMERAIRKSMDLPPEKVVVYIQFRYLIRYMLTGVVLAVAAMQPSINLYATIIGILLPMPAVYIAKAIYKDHI